MTKLLNFIVVSRESFCQYQTHQSKGIFRRFRKIEKSKISLIMFVRMSVRPSVRMEQFNYKCPDFCES